MPQAILLQDHETLGERGTVVDVSKGYLRNYLIPRKLAEPATKGAIAAAERRAAGRRARGRRGDREGAQENAELLNKTVLTIPHQAGDDGRLFGSVTSQDIADAIKEARGIEIDRRKVHLDEPIRRSARAWSSSRSPTASPRPSRPWSSSRSSGALRARLPAPRSATASRRPATNRRTVRTERPRRLEAPDGAPRLGPAHGAPQTSANGRRRVAPPQNLEAEQSVLGAVLLSDTALPALIIDERLQPGGLLPRGHGVDLPRRCSTSTRWASRSTR